MIKLLPVLIVICIGASCAKKNNSKIFWVSGMKSECTNGDTNMQCLNVHQGENIDNPLWTIFYDNIEGFSFEKGIIKKIEVREDKIENITVDTFSIKYTMIREIEKITDNRVGLNGKWTLVEYDGSQIDKNLIAPEMLLNVKQLKVNGTGGCNSYLGEISKLNTSRLQFGEIATTRRACLTDNMEQDFLDALNNVVSYKLGRDQLRLYDKESNNILTLIKTNEPQVQSRLHDIWAAISINGFDIDKSISVPRLEINLTQMKVYGNDGCNNFNGNIEDVSEDRFSLGFLRTTRKMCETMEVSNKFNIAMSKVETYTITKQYLVLLGADGTELVKLVKVD